MAKTTVPILLSSQQNIKDKTPYSTVQRISFLEAYIKLSKFLKKVWISNSALLSVNLTTLKTEFNSRSTIPSR